MNNSTPPTPPPPGAADGTTCDTSVQSTDAPLVVTANPHPAPYHPVGEQPSVGMSALVDYIAMTVPNCQPAEAVRAIGYEPSLFEPAKPTVEQRRLWGYRNRWDHEWIKVLFSKDNPGAGVRVEMTGQACRQWESEHPDDTLIDLLLAGQVVGVTMHRLDGAIDDQEESLDLKTMEEDRVNKRFTFLGNKTHCKVGEHASDLTVCFGSRKSDIMFRTYTHKGPAGQKVGGQLPPACVRFEMETHRRKAEEFRDLIVDLGSVGAAVAGVARHYLNFRMPKEGDSNKSRWGVAPYWLSFLGGAEKARLAKPKSVARIEGVVAWLFRQAAVYLALARRFGGDALIEALLAAGEANMKPHHLAILPPYLRHPENDLNRYDAEREAEYAEYRAWCEDEAAEALRLEWEADESADSEEDWDNCGILAARDLRRDEEMPFAS